MGPAAGTDGRTKRMWAQALVGTSALDSLSTFLARFEDWIVESARSGQLIWILVVAVGVFVAYRLLRNL
jgi:hypothetical protein